MLWAGSAVCVEAQSCAGLLLRKHHLALPASTLSVTGCLHTSLPLFLQVHLSDVALPPIKQWKGPTLACTAQLAVAECAASPALAFSVWVGAQDDCGMFAKASCAVCRAKSALATSIAPGAKPHMCQLAGHAGANSFRSTPDPMWSRWELHPPAFSPSAFSPSAFSPSADP